MVCKQLGYIGARSRTKESRFGRVEDNFAMDQVLRHCTVLHYFTLMQVVCDGTEERLLDCRYRSTDDCGAGEGAGAICDTRTDRGDNLPGEDCYEVGVGYNAGDWIDFDITGTARDCQTHCRSHTECSHFTFYTDTHKCYRQAVV